MADMEVQEGLGQAEGFEETAEQAKARLAGLAPLEYGQVRKQEAKRLGVPVGLLDEEVKRARRQNGHDDSDRALRLPEPEPWPEPVNGDDLLDQLCRAFRRYLALGPGADVILALWTVHAHCFDTGAVSPRLVLKSPEKRCGKTTTLIILSHLVPRPLPVANITAAAIFRTVEAARPTILIDEADTFLEGDELRGILNSGHFKPMAFVVRNVGDDHEPRQFSTWSPVAIAVIGALRDTLEDRSIIVEMRRRRPDERVDRVRLDRLDHLGDLASQAARWAQDNTIALRQADPDIPEGFHDRAADNWRPLFAIADLAGGSWPDRARQVALASMNAVGDDPSAKVQLLADIQTLFNRYETDRLASTAICKDLADMEDRPWPEWRHGKPITTRQLARLLSGFKIRSKQIWIGGENRHGYELKQFQDAFARYIPSIRSARTLDARDTAACSEFTNARTNSSLADGIRPKPKQTAGSSVLADRKGEPRGIPVSETEYECEERLGIQSESEADPDDPSTYLDDSDFPLSPETLEANRFLGAEPIPPMFDRRPGVSATKRKD